jgi:vanillate monooxygenase
MQPNEDHYLHPAGLRHHRDHDDRNARHRPRASPETERSSHYFWASTRDFEIGNADITAFFHRETLRAFNEDKDILEAQQACIDLDPGAPIVHVPTDIGGIQARRMVARLIEEEVPAQGIAAQ